MSVPVTAHDQVAQGAHEAAWDDDALAHAEYDAAADDHVIGARERWLPSIPILAAAAFIGITSGIGWWTFGPKSATVLDTTCDRCANRRKRYLTNGRQRAGANRARA